MNAADLASLPQGELAALARSHEQRLLRHLTVTRHWRICHSRFRDSPLGTGAGPSRFGPTTTAAGDEPPFAVLYLAQHLATALYETIVRDRFDLLPERILDPEVYQDHVAFRISTKPDTTLALLDLTDMNAVTSGIPNDVFRYSSHADGQYFAEYVHTHMPAVDGILYESRFTRRPAIAVFDRAAHRLEHVDTRGLDRDLVHAGLWRFNITVECESRSDVPADGG